MKQTSKPSRDSLFVASSRRNYVLWEMASIENMQKAEDNAGECFIGRTGNGFEGKQARMYDGMLRRPTLYKYSNEMGKNFRLMMIS